MTYDEANAALHALRDAGYDDMCLYMTKEGYEVGRDIDGGEVLTESQIDKLIQEKGND